MRRRAARPRWCARCGQAFRSRLPRSLCPGCRAEKFVDVGEAEDAFGIVTDDGAWYKAGGVRYLADLIDPTAWENTVEDNHRLLDRCRELERKNARLKAHVRVLELFKES